MNESDKLLRRFIIGFIIVILFISIPLIIFFTKFNITSNSIDDRLKKKNSFIIVIRDNECSKCNDIEASIKKSNISYNILYTSNNMYSNILEDIGLDNSSIYTPSVVYIRKGKLYSFLNVESMSMLNTYLNNLEG